jgi:hypothetical protein
MVNIIVISKEIILAENGVLMITNVLEVLAVIRY